MNIKVCGITDFKQLQQIEALNIDFGGMVFQEHSLYFIGEKLKKTDIKKADFEFKKTGVFENPEMIDILDAIDDYGLDVVQLNGNETPEMCEDASSEVEVIKAFTIDNKTTHLDELVAEYDAVCDYYLFIFGNDLSSAQGFELLKKAKIEKPFFIGGNLSINDIAAINAFKHPDFFGIDLNTAIENETGLKDMKLLLQFTLGLRK